MLIQIVRNSSSNRVDAMFEEGRQIIAMIDRQ